MASKDVDLIMKKMREKNAEILLRHQEVEEDKRNADNVISQTKKHQKEVRSRPPKQQALGKSPPPDPRFNFLSDSLRKRRVENKNRCPETNDNRCPEMRRHPNNFGGCDFSNVKPAIKQLKSHFKGGSDEDLTMSMTGRERIEHRKWQQEREEVDRARIQRQRTHQGTWKREWDAGKDFDCNGGLSPESLDQGARPTSLEEGTTKDSLPRGREIHIRESCTNSDILKQFVPPAGKVVSDSRGKIVVTLINKRKEDEPMGGLGRAQFRNSSRPKGPSNTWTSLMGSKAPKLRKDVSEDQKSTEALESKNSTEQSGESFRPQTKVKPPVNRLPKSSIIENWPQIAANDRASNAKLLAAFQNLTLTVGNRTTADRKVVLSPKSDLKCQPSEKEIYYSDSNDAEEENFGGNIQKCDNEDDEWEDVSD